MRKITVVLCGLFLGMVILSQAAQAAEKFAYVELSRLFSDYNKTKDYYKVLSEKEDSYNSEKEKKINDFKAMTDKLNLLSDKEKEAKRSDLESKAKAVQEWDMQKRMDLRKDEDERTKEILKDIEDTVAKYAQKEGITFVFLDRVLIYQTKSYDITDKILDILNKGYTPKKGK